MSEERLRDLERRFLESGSDEDELAWLSAQVRSGRKLDWSGYSRLHELDADAAADYLGRRVRWGDLSRERVELAAYCGHPRTADRLELAAELDQGWLRALEDRWPAAARHLALALAQWLVNALGSGATAAERRQLEELRVALATDDFARLDQFPSLTVLGRDHEGEHPDRRWARETLVQLAIPSLSRPLTLLLRPRLSPRFSWAEVRGLIQETIPPWALGPWPG
ncbi:MAG: hypothetical protein AB7N76_07890 [Planctomycetota bacterium]